ncbi:MAG TPA: transposase [Candidatus Paceibacterota bacterium]
MREKLVEILTFCLMPNHYHLLIRQIQEKGIVRFMQKLGTSYTNYFNLKNNRVGPLFQGRFKAILVQKDEHLRHLYNYIHLNPLDLFAPEWRENKLNNQNGVLEFLGNYRWSSYLDYVGKKNFPSIINTGLGLEIFENTKKYADDIQEWLSNIEKYHNNFNNLFLE